MQEEICNKLLAESASEFVGIKEKINPNKLIYEFKTEGKISEKFRDYRMPLELFENLRDGDLNPKEVLKNQVTYKLLAFNEKVQLFKRKCLDQALLHLIISNAEMNDMKKSLEDAILMIKNFSETTENEAKEQKGRYFGMLLGRLGASLLGYPLTSKRVKRPNRDEE